MFDAEIGVIGLGPAGCLCLASLPDQVQEKTIAFYSGAIGGDLLEKYGSVRANLTRQQMERAFRKIPTWSHDPLSVLAAYGPEECPPLAGICQQLVSLTEPILNRLIAVIQTCVSEVRHVPAGWEIRSCDGLVWRVQKVMLCTGAEPRSLDIVPHSKHIPLACALNVESLKAALGPRLGRRVVVIGMSHSGVLVLRNLVETGLCESIVGVYRGPTPFRWARYGETEGLKQEAAVIADDVMAGRWGSKIRLLSWDKREEVEAALEAAEHVIYAIGFQCRSPNIVDMRGKMLDIQHDPTTGLLAPGLWGFGIGFPAQYTTNRGTLAPDVSFSAFAEQILVCMGAIQT